MCTHSYVVLLCTTYYTLSPFNPVIVSYSLCSFLPVYLWYVFSPGSTQSLPCHTTSGDNCTSSICPNTVVNYTCTITSGTPVGYTDWTLPTGTCPTNPSPGTIRLSQYVSGFCAALATSTCGPYTASSLPPSDATYCLSSILSVNVTAAMNGSTVMCSNTNIGTLASTVVSSATISVVGMLFICMVY